MSAFVQTIASGDIAGLTRLLTDDAVMLSDAGGLISAVAQSLQGDALIATVLPGFNKNHVAQNYPIRLTHLNGLPAGVPCNAQGNVLQTTALQRGADSRICVLYIVRIPEKLTGIGPLQ